MLGPCLLLPYRGAAAPVGPDIQTFAGLPIVGQTSQVYNIDVDVGDDSRSKPILIWMGVYSSSNAIWPSSYRLNGNDMTWESHQNRTNYNNICFYLQSALTGVQTFSIDFGSSGNRDVSICGASLGGYVATAPENWVGELETQSDSGNIAAANAATCAVIGVQSHVGSTRTWSGLTNDTVVSGSGMRMTMGLATGVNDGSFAISSSGGGSQRNMVAQSWALAA